jgi:hypothetical protein
MCTKEVLDGKMRDAERAVSQMWADLRAEDPQFQGPRGRNSVAATIPSPATQHRGVQLPQSPGTRHRGVQPPPSPAASPATSHRGVRLPLRASQLGQSSSGSLKLAAGSVRMGTSTSAHTASITRLSSGTLPCATGTSGGLKRLSNSNENIHAAAGTSSVENISSQERGRRDTAHATIPSAASARPKTPGARSPVLSAHRCVAAPGSTARPPTPGSARPSTSVISPAGPASFKPAAVTRQRCDVPARAAH